ncbi:class I SAM-dependent methyltransferase [Phormidium pseudopriestleyi FRX01]|uniref:Class I SAM-dependent methyltransferase n=1 Tax=Phormidium pseudopriestleyi FRX01 TaxID=1759528 RepID=A0ABS3FQ86_9CYAN|nr:class I SAM-dependent methyltransferase [Phormidium pseudopriestleyi]MBO0349198.1 class I SAM-dependent methyltransferase [Phormidium pseudopriestleyi FRX01]
MHELENVDSPQVVSEILIKTKEVGFQMVSEPLVGSLLRTLALSKPSGRFLELGTGTGVSTAWILNGMDSQSALLTVENDPALLAIAQDHLGQDSRVTFHQEDGGTFMERLSQTPEQFDLIFADTWAGKYTHFEEAIQALKPGGFYIIDDMLPQPTWPEGHEVKVKTLITALENRRELMVTKISWASGVILAVKR